jgi:predicted transcriptional regulator
MAKKRQTIEPIDDMRDTMKKLLALELFKMNVAQVEIAKKLHMDLNAVNAFLKGIKK